MLMIKCNRIIPRYPSSLEAHVSFCEFAMHWSTFNDEFAFKVNKLMNKLMNLPLKFSRGIRFQKCNILTRVDSDELLQPPFKLDTPNGVQSVA